MKLRGWIGIAVAVAALLGVLLAAPFQARTSDAGNGSSGQEYFAGQQQRQPKRVRVSHEAFYHEISEKSNAGLRLLLTFWRETFSRNRLRFSAPQVYWSDEPSAFYNSDHHRIYLNLDQFLAFKLEVEEKTRTDGDLAYLAVLAHEYAHAAQRNLRIRSERTKDHELQADCLAGAFVGYLNDQGYLEEGDLDEATCMFFLARDPTGTHPDHEEAHGTGTERVAAFHRGVGGGVRACRCNLQ